jgi:hypothetical protein
MENLDHNVPCPTIIQVTNTLPVPEIYQTTRNQHARNGKVEEKWLKTGRHTV